MQYKDVCCCEKKDQLKSEVTSLDVILQSIGDSLRSTNKFDFELAHGLAVLVPTLKQRREVFFSHPEGVKIRELLERSFHIEEWLKSEDLDQPQAVVYESWSR
jgi:hypothetical protein